MLRFSKFFTVLEIFMILVITHYNGLCQKEGLNWIFGDGTGLQFDENGGVSSLSSSIHYIFSSCASISDKEGNLLFYTEGTKVWNRTGQVMPNSLRLAGFGTTQRALIVKKPLSDNLYYIFTHTGLQELELHYSIVDMSTNMGLGDVVEKNTLLRQPVAHKLEAVLHSNGRDIWLLAHGEHDDFLAYLLTPDGIQPPVVSHTGPFQEFDKFRTGNSNASGELKASVDGTLLGMAIHFKGVYLFDFDNNSGHVSYKVTIKETEATSTVYRSVEFSPDNSKFYFTGRFQDFPPVHICNLGVYQVDLTLPTHAEIRDSVFELARDCYTTIQLAPDGKIYVTNADRTSRFPQGRLYVSVIEQPNQAREKSSFVSNAIYLGGKMVQSGLVDMPKFYLPYHAFNIEHACLGEATLFSLTSTLGISSVSWDFGDGVTSNEPNPNHIYTATGQYTVTLSFVKNGETEIHTKTLDIQPLPEIDIGDVSLCAPPPQEVTLVGNVKGLDYLWQNSFGGENFTVQDSGTYWVEARNGSCFRGDTIHVDINEPFSFSFGEDRSICEEDITILKLPDEIDGFTWNTGHQQPNLVVEESGRYEATVWRGACTAQSSVVLEVDRIPEIDLGPDTNLCYGETLTLEARFPEAMVIWNDSIHTQTLEVSDSGLFKVALLNGACSYRDSIKVTFDFCESLLSIPNVFTPNGDAINDVFLIKGSGNGWKLDVFNRQGKSVYSSSDYRGNWGAEGLPSGVFFYTFENRQFNKAYSGYVQVLR